MRAPHRLTRLAGAAVVLIGTPLSAQTTAAAPTPARAAIKSTAAIAHDATPATVTILALDRSGDTVGQGSGFLVRPDGTILTNWHVLAGASNAIVILATQETFARVSFIDGDSAADLAVIRIPGYGLPILQTRSSTPEVGERVIAIGSPLGLSHTVTEGIVSAIRMANGKQLVQISAAISPGSSGGAVLDGTGRVFAIATSYMEDAQQLNFAVPVRYALGLIAGTPKERPLAEVFASSSPYADGRGRTADSRPVATSAPRPELRGTFFTEEAWTIPADSLSGTEIGLLFWSGEVGWQMSAPQLPGDSVGPVSVYRVRSLRTDARGQVALDVGGIAYDGYQTDDGFVVDGADTEKSGSEQIEFVLHATETPIELTRPSGLYRLTMRTRFHFSKSSLGDAIDWSGDAAIAVVKDSIWVSLIVHNTSGGSSGLIAHSTISKDGSFSVSSSDGTNVLKGRIRAGVLDGDWIDKRDGGSWYDGRLHGERY